jgi:acyl-coenzyme A synthetase/AMP-(fatty) acid ligase
VHAHRAILARQYMMQGWYGLTPQDRMLHAGAFNWTYTLGTGLMDPWTMGATALIPAPGTNPTVLPALLADHSATIFAAAPGVYRQLLRANLPPMPHLRHGMSEVSTFLSGSPSCPAPEGFAGYPQTGRRVELLDTDGLPTDQGTIAVHRDDQGLFLGYLDDAETTNARFQGDWFLTGDQGVRGPDGAMRTLGRADDMMNAGGYRVSPLEVEAAMARHECLTDCAAVEVEVKPGTTLIALHYTAKSALDPKALDQHAQRQLARYKQPRLYQYHENLPRNANGKLNRQALRDWPFPKP